MHDPVAELRTRALVGLIRARFRVAHRKKLPDMIALSLAAETVHAEESQASNRLARPFEAMVADREAHMREEAAAVFPTLAAGVSAPLPGLREDHAGHEAAPHRTPVILDGFRLPQDVFGAWRRPYAGLGKLAGYPDEHGRLEGIVCFSRFGTGR